MTFTFVDRCPIATAVHIVETLPESLIRRSFRNYIRLIGTPMALLFLCVFFAGEMDRNPDPILAIVAAVFVGLIDSIPGRSLLSKFRSQRTNINPVASTTCADSVSLTLSVAIYTDRIGNLPLRKALLS